MTLKKYLNLMIILTLISWLIWVGVILFINPEYNGILGIILFHFSLFLSILGTLSLLGFLVRSQLGKKPIFKQVGIAFRQALLFSIFVIAVLILKSIGLLYWWNTLFLAIFLIFVEYFFLTSGKVYKDK